MADQVVAGTTCTVATQVAAEAPDRSHPYTSHSTMGFGRTVGLETQPPGGGMSHNPYRCDNGQGSIITFNRY